jgi:hypothetical protein
MRNSFDVVNFYLYKNSFVYAYTSLFKEGWISGSLIPYPGGVFKVSALDVSDVSFIR